MRGLLAKTLLHGVRDGFEAELMSVVHGKSCHSGEVRRRAALALGSVGCTACTCDRLLDEPATDRGVANILRYRLEISHQESRKRSQVAIVLIVASGHYEGHQV